MIQLIAKYCNKYLISFIFSILLLLFGTLIYIKKYFISDLIVVGLLLFIAFISRVSNNKNKRNYAYFYCLFGLIIINFCYNLICSFFMDVFFGIISNIVFALPLFLLVWKVLSAIDLTELYIQDPNATIEDKKKNSEFTKFTASTLIGLWTLFVGCLITLIFGKSNWVWFSIFLPVILLASFFTIKYIILLIVFQPWIGVKTWRIIFNLFCLIAMVLLAFLFSDDKAFYAGKGEINLFVFIGIIIFFYFPFKTGHTTARLLFNKKTQKKIKDETNLFR